MKRFAFSLLALASSVGLFAVFFLAHLSIAPRQSGFLPAEVRIDQGEPLSAVVRKLRENRVISNERLFSLWARLTGAEKKNPLGTLPF